MANTPLDVFGIAAVGQALNVGSQLLSERLSELRPRGGRQSAQRGAVIGRLEGEDAGSRSGHPGGLESDLDRIGPGDGVVHQTVVDRRDLGQARSQLNARGVSGYVGKPVKEVLALPS